MDGRDGAAQRAYPSPGTDRRPSLLLPLLAVVVALTVVAGAALAGPWRMRPADAPPPAELEETPAPQPTAPGEPPPPPELSDNELPVTLILVIVGALLLAYLLRLFLRRATLARGTNAAPDEPAPGSVGVEAAVEVEPDLPALRRGVTAARSVLASRADPDDAIIAAWLELEAAAASSGVDRAPSDTPTELTTAVLDATRADPDATRTLLRLYHRARFAPHAVLTASDVAAAGRCLELLAESWAER